MSLLPRRKVHTGPGQRPPVGTVAVGSWIARELWTLLYRMTAVIDWASEYLGKVQVDSTDEPKVLESALVNSATIIWTKTGAVGARTLSATASGWGAAFPGFYEDDPEPDGDADPGNSATASHGNHVHPKQTNAPCVAFCGAQVALTGTWTQGPTGTWTKDTADIVSGTSWADGQTLAAGNRIFVCDRVASLTVFHSIHAGIYDFVQDGNGAAQHAVIRRAADADQNAEFTAGMSVLVTGGDDFAGVLYLTSWPVVVGTTVQYWAWVPVGGAPGGGVTWDLVGPSGTARVPIPTATLAAADSGGNNGKLSIGSSNYYLVNPNGLDLTQIQTPNVPAGVTVVLTLIFTAPVMRVPNVVPDTGFSKLHLAYDVTVTGLELANSYSSVQVIYIAALSAWLQIGENET
jgi:hypothetical protein